MFFPFYSRSQMVAEETKLFMRASSAIFQDAPQMVADEKGVTLMTYDDKEDMEKFTGDSFRDLTRIARINDQMWSELFVANKPALLSQMNMFIDKFNELKRMLETEDIDGMRGMIRHSTQRRALFDKK